MSSDHERRNLEAGLPATLHFHLKRNAGPVVKLELKENTRLNAHAPVFEPVSDVDGKQRLIKKSNLPLLVRLFFRFSLRPIKHSDR